MKYTQEYGNFWITRLTDNSIAITNVFLLKFDSNQSKTRERRIEIARDIENLKQNEYASSYVINSSRISKTKRTTEIQMT